MKWFYAVLMLCMFLISGCSNTANDLRTVNLKLGWQHGVQFTGYYIAQAKGFYADEGLDVQINAIEDPSEVFSLAQQVVDGEYDFSMNTTPLINDQVNGLPVTTIATILQFSPQAFFARQDSGIQTPADFEGKRVAVTTSSTQQILEELLAINNLTLDDVEVVPSSWDMTPFYEGEVDIWVGYLTNEVVQVRLQGVDVTTFPAYEYGIRTTEDMIFTRTELVEEDPELATGFVRATIRGWEWVVENPSEAIDMMLAEYPQLTDDREFYLASLDAYIPIIRPPGIQIGTINCEKWLDHTAFQGLDNTDDFCTTLIFDEAINERSED